MSDVQTAPVAAPVVESAANEHSGYVDVPKTFSEHHDATAATTEAKTEAAPAAIAEPKEEKVTKDDVAITAQPISSGVLGYKAPGLVNQLRFKKHHFWVGDEPVDHKQLSNYLRGEKPEVANPTAAWSSQTGKGLLYFAKADDAKKAPIGILNLSELSEMTKEGNTDFSFKLNKHKHTFAAKDKKERDGWVVAIEKEHEAAVKTKDEVMTGSTYKETLSKLGGPAAGAAVATGGAAATAGAATVVAKDSDKSEPKDAAPVGRSSTQIPAEDKKAKDSKTRSASRGGKRSSVFGMFGKKDEQKDEKKEDEKAKKEEEKKEEQAEKAEKKENEKEVAAAAAAEKQEEKREEKADKEAEKAEKKEEKKVEEIAKADQKTAEKEMDKEIKKAEKEEKIAEKEEAKEAKKEEKEHKEHKAEATATGAAAVGTAGTAAAVAHEKDEKKDEKKVDDSKSKRRSIFGSLFEKKSEPEKKKEEAKPATSKKTEATKDAFADDPVSAPGSKPIVPTEVKLEGAFANDPVSPETSKKETAAAGAATTAPAATSPSDKTEKRKSAFGLGSMKKKEGDSEATKANRQSSGSKLGEIFRRPSKAAKDSKKDEKKVADKPTTVAEGAEETPNTAIGGAPAADAEKIETIKPVDAAPTTEVAGEKTNGHVIGDVVPEAVRVGEAQTPAATVSTAA